MPVLYINFNHPIKGTASLKQLNSLNSRSLNILVDSKSSDQVEIPTDDCNPGKWMMTFNWQHEGRSFSYNRPFEVQAAPKV